MSADPRKINQATSMEELLPAEPPSENGMVVLGSLVCPEKYYSSMRKVLINDGKNGQIGKMLLEAMQILMTAEKPQLVGIFSEEQEVVELQNFEKKGVNIVALCPIRKIGESVQLPSQSQEDRESQPSAREDGEIPEEDELVMSDREDRAPMREEREASEVDEPVVSNHSMASKNNVRTGNSPVTNDAPAAQHRSESDASHFSIRIIQAAIKLKESRQQSVPTIGR